MKSNHTPDIRFSGFTGEWEERKLKEIVERVTRKNTKLESTLPLTISAQYGLVDQVTFFNKQVASKDVSNYYLLKNGEFAYNKSYSNGYPWGAVKRLDRYDMGVLSTLYITFKPTLINSDFLVSYYDTTRWHKEVSMRAAEGARNHGLLNISASEFFDTNLKVPNKEEQIKIGNFFKQLDDTIALHQQELTVLKQTKKGFLQKMFPKEGESVPEVRFPGFTGEWKERKFKDDIVSIQTGTNLLGSKNNSGTPLIKMGNIQRGYFSLDKLEYLDDNETVSELDIIKNGDFLFNTRNTLELVGKGATWFREGGKYAFNSNIARFTFKNINTYFFNYLYNTEQVIRQVRARAVGTTSVAAVYPRDLNSMKYMVPSIEEQSEIGNFFKQLDYTITLHQSELDALKEMKIAFLQKMFA
ncbi:restriction endonuclease subunit S [Bacillus cereus]|nr:restriction endonuclease subunit S [Bacillus cereus]